MIFLVGILSNKENIFQIWAQLSKPAVENAQAR